MRVDARAVLRLALAGAAFAAATPAAAQESWYASISGGQSITDDGLVANRESTIHDATNIRTAFDDKGNAWRASLGWRFHPNLAVEAGYSSFGKTTMDTRFVVPLGATQAGRVYTDRKVEGFGIDLVASWPILEHFALLARLGYFAGSTETTTTLSGDVVFTDGTPGTTRTNKSRENLTKGGLGLEWLFSRDASMRIEWERLGNAGKPFAPGATGTTGEADVDAVLVGLVWRFR